MPWSTEVRLILMKSIDYSLLRTFTYEITLILSMWSYLAAEMSLFTLCAPLVVACVIKCQYLHLVHYKITTYKVVVGYL